jgi:hypothetical protein
MQRTYGEDRQLTSIAGMRERLSQITAVDPAAARHLM